MRPDSSGKAAGVVGEGDGKQNVSSETPTEMDQELGSAAVFVDTVAERSYGESSLSLCVQPGRLLIARVVRKLDFYLLPMMSLVCTTMRVSGVPVG